MSKFTKPTLAAIALITLALCGCGGGGGGGGAAPLPPLPPPPPPSGIGPAGGTVNGPDGSSVVIPAGALAQNVNIEIVRSTATLPPLPPGMLAVGDFYTFLPHGTSFAVPVTITVPFDQALVPAGAQPRLIKISPGETIWETVPVTAVAGGLVSGHVTSFSDDGAVVSEPVITGEPQDVTVPPGGTATFMVEAEDNNEPPLSLAYQWLEDGVVIPGEETASYTLDNVTPADDGRRFFVRVTNSVGSVDSREATLTVEAVGEGWEQVGAPIGGPLTLGGIAISSVLATDNKPRVAVSYLTGSGGAGGAPNVVTVSEWDGTDWNVLSGNGLSLQPDARVNLGTESIAYDAAGRLVVTWVETYPGVTQRVWTAKRYVGSGNWEDLGPILQPSTATAGAPGVRVDPATNRTVAWLSAGVAGEHVRDYTGSGWTTGGSGTGYFIGGLVMLDSGQRLLMLIDPEGIEPGERRARFYAPNNDQQYVIPFSNLVLTTPILSANFVIQTASDGIQAYALAGDRVNGPVIVRRMLAGGSWVNEATDLGLLDPGFIAVLRVASGGVPFVAYRPDGAWPFRVGLAVWNGASWVSATSPVDSNIGVGHFALELDATGTPHMALSLVPSPGPFPTDATELRVLRAD